MKVRLRERDGERGRRDNGPGGRRGGEKRDPGGSRLAPGLPLGDRTFQCHGHQRPGLAAAELECSTAVLGRRGDFLCRAQCFGREIQDFAWSRLALVRRLSCRLSERGHNGPCRRSRRGVCPLSVSAGGLRAGSATVLPAFRSTLATEPLVLDTSPSSKFDAPRNPATNAVSAVSYTHLRAHETDSYLVCRL